MTTPSTIERPRVGDPDLDFEEPRVAHIVEKDKIAEAYIEGTPLTALCGTVFVPSRDPKKVPPCEPCRDIAEQAWGDDAGKIGS